MPGIILLFPRTAFAGALALFPVTLNITAMDFGFGFPGVKYLVTIYTLLLGLLIWAERDRVWALVRPADEPARPVGRLVNGLSTGSAMQGLLLSDQARGTHQPASPPRADRGVLEIVRDPRQIRRIKLREPDPLQRNGRGTPLRHPCQPLDLGRGSSRNS